MEVSPTLPFSPSLLDVPRLRARGSSLPSPISSTELYRLRNFAVSGNKVINKGDSYCSRPSSINSLNSSEENMHLRSPAISSRSSSTHNDNIQCHSAGLGSRQTSRTPSIRSQRQASWESTGESLPVFRVMMLGGAGVGKSSLCSQFLSSEHANTYERVEDTLEKEVIVAVNDKQSRIVFIDHQHGEMSLDILLATYEPHAFLVVLAVDDLGSLDTADYLLGRLESSGSLASRAAILVANKTDLVRNREVKSGMGKQLASKYNVKYIETSPGINHNIDELLVGVFTQISLRQGCPIEDQAKAMNKVGHFFGRLLSRQGGASRSCSNLSEL